ncbi:MAG: hypothetical protein PHI97_27415 [Desulfobulbus sp.]|nr:hypothetical protein [Desulfobulbus sp.]
MSCKPMHKRTALGSRQAVWEAIRSKEVFTIKNLREETVMKADSVREYVIGLEAAGYIERVPQEELRLGADKCWRLINDIGHDAPRVRRDGTQVTQGQGRENMWQAMRMMRAFTAKELAIHARTPGCHVEESTAEDYARHLWHAGYLRREKDGSYLMLPTAYTGPRAPMIQLTKVVWDPNQNKIRWRSGDLEVNCDE